MHSIVHTQAEGAVDRYDVHVVVANLLETRKDRVWLVRRALSSPGDVSSADGPHASDSTAEAVANSSDSMSDGTREQKQGHTRKSDKQVLRAGDRPPGCG